MEELLGNDLANVKNSMGSEKIKKLQKNRKFNEICKKYFCFVFRVLLIREGPGLLCFCCTICCYDQRD